MVINAPISQYVMQLAHHLTANIFKECCLDNQAAIDAFVAYPANKVILQKYELSLEDWSVITSAANWLGYFRSATTQMSATKTSMLSTTHGIF